MLEPAQATDRTELRRILLRRAWMLETDAADWVVKAESGSRGLHYLHFLLPPADVGSMVAMRRPSGGIGQAMAVMSPSSK